MKEISAPRSWKSFNLINIKSFLLKHAREGSGGIPWALHSQGSRCSRPLFFFPGFRNLNAGLDGASVGEEPRVKGALFPAGWNTALPAGSDCNPHADLEPPDMLYSI